MTKSLRRFTRPTHFGRRYFPLGLLLLSLVWLAASAVPLRGTPQNNAPAAAEPREFAGTWKASLKDQTFVVLTLKVENDKLSGTIRTGQVDLADDGEVSQVNEAPGEPRALLEIKLTGSTLSFKDKDGDDINFMEMKLTGTDRADLKFILPEPLPEGLPRPKPFRLTRGASSPTGARGN